MCPTQWNPNCTGILDTCTQPRVKCLHCLFTKKKHSIAQKEPLRQTKWIQFWRSWPTMNLSGFSIGSRHQILCLNLFRFSPLDVFMRGWCTSQCQMKTTQNLGTFVLQESTRRLFGNSRTMCITHPWRSALTTSEPPAVISTWPTSFTNRTRWTPRILSMKRWCVSKMVNLCLNLRLETSSKFWNGWVKAWWSRGGISWCKTRTLQHWQVAGIWFDHLHKIITLRRTAAEKPKGLLESEEEEEEEENGLGLCLFSLFQTANVLWWE